MAEQGRCTDCEWSAEARHEHGQRILTVRGTCVCPQGGYELSLEADNPGIVPQPEVVALRLVELEPDFGTGEVVRTPVVECRMRISDRIRRIGIRGHGVVDVQDVD